MESKYLKRFKNLKGQTNLKGNLMIVEKIPEPEIKTKSGIILGDHTHKQLGTIRDQLPQFCIVLEVGPGYVDDAGNVVEGSMDVEVGNVVLLPDMALRQFSAIPGLLDYYHNTIALAKEDEVQMKFKSIEEYQAYFDILNEEVKDEEKA